MLTFTRRKRLRENNRRRILIPEKNKGSKFNQLMFPTEEIQVNHMVLNTSHLLK